MSHISFMSTPARGPRDPSRRRRILDAAKAEFTRSGFKGTNLDAIAQAAGCAKGALYLEFPDKRTLLRELVLEVFAGIRARYEQEVVSRGSPLQRIVGTLAFAFREMLREPLFAKLMREDPELRELLVTDPVQAAAAAKVEIDQIAGWVDEGIARGEIRPDVDRDAIPYALGVLRFSPQHLGLITELGLFSGERTLATIVELFERGLAARPGPDTPRHGTAAGAAVSPRSAKPTRKTTRTRTRTR